MDFKDFNHKVIEEFRANSGKLSGQFAGAHILLLTTKGAKSGKLYVNPLAYTSDGDKFVIAAGYGGAPKNPSWYHNVVAHPAPSVEIGAERFQAKATFSTGLERERLFNLHAARWPVLHEYQKQTTRQIPVIVLERIG